MERENGYYWIRLVTFHAEWRIAMYRKSMYPQGYRELILQNHKSPDYKRCCEWFIGDWFYPDDDIIEIDETEIKRDTLNK